MYVCGVYFSKTYSVLFYNNILFYSVFSFCFCMVFSGYLSIYLSIICDPLPSIIRIFVCGAHSVFVMM